MKAGRFAPSVFPESDAAAETAPAPLKAKDEWYYASAAARLLSSDGAAAEETPLETDRWKHNKRRDLDWEGSKTLDLPQFSLHS